ncbi:hypothetical protein AFERRI_110005 [Acidithiobacillus ferrivorans]|uniref:Uncharacterized protein n=1 Tax=Acidithiobacillus ferrivorans TaxID=160808 RepID=A0A060UKD8_9PROT|nr:hypothetical protein AFERRI_110005 [Acidithiobacillus ferrivorans]
MRVVCIEVFAKPMKYISSYTTMHPWLPTPHLKMQHIRPSSDSYLRHIENIMRPICDPTNRRGKLWALLSKRGSEAYCVGHRPTKQ